MIPKIVQNTNLAALKLFQLHNKIPKLFLLQKSFYMPHNMILMQRDANAHCWTKASPCSFPQRFDVTFPMLSQRPSLISIRHKSRRRQQDSDDDSDSDIDDKLDDDDFDAPPQFKIQTIHAPSLRTDAVLSNALSISRHRLEELFFSSSLLLNGAKMVKKGAKLDEGDYVDVIMEKLEDQIKVKRVKLLRIGSEKTGTDKFILKVRVWKSPFLLDFTRKRD